MDKFCTHALESLLRGSNWEAKFKEFYFNVCPRFKDFSTSSFSASYADGSGFDVLMFEAYRNFITFFDLNIHIYLDQMGVSLTTLEESLANNLREGDSSAESLYSQFEMYGDFLKFSAIMKSKFQETFLNLESDRLKPEGTIILNEGFSKDGSLEVPQPHLQSTVSAENSGSTKIPKKGRSVRVLWDIENVPIMKSMGGLATLAHLNRFLRTQDLLGSGIDCRISAFFAPLEGKIPRTAVEELDKGAVELIWVSSKREDADRKLGNRVNQEMIVLDPTTTTFVIISSDQDFRHHYQLLSGAGFKVIVVHDAKGGTWTQVLEMHADKAFLWRDIMANKDLEVGVESSYSESRSIGGTSSISSDGDGLGGPADGGEGEELPQSVIEELSSRGRRSSKIIMSDLGVTPSGIAGGNLGGSGGLATGVGKAVKGILNTSTSTDRVSGDDRPLNINLSRPSTGNGGGTERSHHVHFEDPQVTASKNEITAGNGISVDAEIDKTYLAAVTQLSSLKMLVDEKKNKNKTVDLFDQTATIEAPVGASLGWMEGTCIRWKGTFGFLSVSSSGYSRPSSAMSRSDGFVPKSVPSVHIVAGPIRVYAHYKSLNFIPFAMTLKRGQKVRVLVEMSDRGPCAKKVEAV